MKPRWIVTHAKILVGIAVALAALATSAWIINGWSATSVLLYLIAMGPLAGAHLVKLSLAVANMGNFRTMTIKAFTEDEADELIRGLPSHSKLHIAACGGPSRKIRSRCCVPGYGLRLRLLSARYPSYQFS